MTHQAKIEPTRLPVVHRVTAKGARLTGVMRPRERIPATRLLAWTYRDQKADLMTGKGLHGLEAKADGHEGGAFADSRSCCTTVEMNGLLGTVIRSTAHQQRPSLHQDAEIIHDVVMGLNWPIARLLMHYGRTGSVPDWGDKQFLEPIIQKGGQVVDYAVAETVRVAYRREVRTVEVCYCPLALYPADEALGAMREVYAMWHRGMSDVAAQLADSPLVRWAVDGIGAPAKPWA